MVTRAGSNLEELLDDGPKLAVPHVAILMIMLTLFIDTLAASISTPVMPYYAKAFHVKTSNIGWLYAVWSFSSTVFAPLLTRLSDKIGRRPVLLMSLLGAGVANVIQGSALFFGHWGFSVFLFGRFFSGIWAAVGSTCNVYVTDVCPEEIRASYLAKMSTVPIVALLFGPGLGGGLSKLGLNVPIMVDGVITLASACLVAYYLPETPTFLKSRGVSPAAVAEEKGQADPTEKPKSTPLPRAVYFLGFAQFLGGINFSTFLSSFAIFMLERYDFDGLRVGFCMMVGSLSMIVVNIWGVPYVNKRFALPTPVVLGGVINSVFYILFAFTTTWQASLACIVVSFVGQSLRGAASTAYLASFSDTTNRGAVFSFSQLCINLGRMIGPVAATHLADWYGPGVPFLMAGIVGLASAALTSLVGVMFPKSPPPAGEGALTPQAEAKKDRRNTRYGSEWEDEMGSKEDIESLGKFVAELLSKNHYQWVSRRADIERLLEHLLPQLHTVDRESHKASFEHVHAKQFCG